MKRIALTLLVTLFASAAGTAGDQRRPCGPGNGHSPLRLLILQGVFGADFRPACRVHDACYGTKGAKKAECDAAFLAGMMCACEHSATPRLCRFVAKAFYGSVRLPVSERFFEGN